MSVQQILGGPFRSINRHEAALIRAVILPTVPPPTVHCDRPCLHHLHRNEIDLDLNTMESRSRRVGQFRVRITGGL